MSCIISTPYTREFAKNNFPGMKESDVRTWIAAWQNSTGSQADVFPTAEQLQSYMINNERIMRLKKSSFISPTGSLSSTGESVMENTFDRKKFPVGVTAVRMHNKDGRTIEIERKDKNTGEIVIASYKAGDDSWRIVNSEGEETVPNTDDRYLEIIQSLVPMELQRFVKDNFLGRLFDITTRTENGNTVATRLDDYMESEYGVFSSGNNTKYNARQLNRALNYAYSHKSNVGSGMNKINEVLSKQKPRPIIEGKRIETGNMETPDDTEQVNISSRSKSVLGKKLTNQGNHITVTMTFKIDGKEETVTFRNAEQAYQALKTGGYNREYYEWSEKQVIERGSNFIPKAARLTREQQGPNYGIMVNILATRFRQHPTLFNELRQAGGIGFLEKAVHTVNPSKPDAYWETMGQNKFIEALTEAYNIVLSERAESGESSILDSYVGTARASEENGESIDDIISGERTSTTRFGLRSGTWWRNRKAGDIIELHDEKSGKKVFIRITQPPVSVTNGEEWAKNDSRGIKYFNRNLLTAVKKGIVSQLMFEVLNESDRAEIEEALSSGEGEAIDIMEEYGGISPHDYEINHTQIDEVLNKVVSRASEIQRKVDRRFSARKRKDRVSLIARQFSNVVDKLIAKQIRDLEDLLKDKSISTVDKLQYLRQLESLKEADGRIAFIKTFTPREIFENIKESFGKYLVGGDTEKAMDARTAAELKKIQKKRPDWSKEEQRTEARRKAELKYKEYSLIVEDEDVYRALCEEASQILMINEGIILDISTGNVEQITTSTFAENEEDANKENGDNQEDTPMRDGWMFDFRTISAMSSLSKKTRKAISNIVRRGYDGTIETDDLGYKRYLDADYVHGVLVDKFDDMQENADDMYLILKDLSKTKPWAKDIIKLLQNDEMLFSQFYHDFALDFVEMEILRTSNDGGKSKINTVVLNRPEGIKNIVGEWRNNIEQGIQISKHSVYSAGGEVNSRGVENAKNIGQPLIAELTDFFQSIDFATAEGREQAIKALKIPGNGKKPDIRKKIDTLLGMVGIIPNPTLLTNVLTDIRDFEKEEEESGEPISDYVKNNYTPSIKRILGSLTTIINGVARGDVAPTTNEEGILEGKDLIGTFQGAYAQMARLISDMDENMTEACSREGNKSYYSHVAPNYLSRLKKKIRNTMGKYDSNPMARFEAWMQRDFGQYEWFYKNGRWRSGWLRLLNDEHEGEKYRRGFNHRILISKDKRECQQWDSIEYFTIMAAQYFSESDEEWAWYAVPVLADATSSEWIRFKRYTSIEGGRSFQDQILDDVTDVILQEYDRIQLVKKRAQTDGVVPIGHYDMSFNKDGSIKSIGGAEFKFFPSLNEKTFSGYGTVIDEVTGERRNKKFLEILEDFMQDEGRADEMNQFIRNTMHDVIEEDFENDYRRLSDMGILDEDSDGNYRHLGFLQKSGQTKTNASLAKKLRRVLDGEKTEKGVVRFAGLRDYINSKISNANRRGDVSTVRMYQSILERTESLINFLENNSYINESEANSVIDLLKNIAQDANNDNIISDQELNNIREYTYASNPIKEKLREMYWNNAYASTQITELLTTDLAFYRDMEDYYKRIKHVHSPSHRLNTKATFHGTLIGKEIEKTILLSDSEIFSAMADDVASVIVPLYQKGGISEYSAANILAKFGYRDAEKYKDVVKIVDKKSKDGKITQYVQIGKTLVKIEKVNVTDGQAYRSINSLRAVLGMVGSWNDTAERVYNNIIADEFNPDDLNIMWNIIKPFTYTQLCKDNGVDGGHIKVPFRNKNSEFTLLAAHAIICQGLGRASKLRAINDFMQKKGVDVVQFESTTKTGKQGVISLEDISTTDPECYDKVMARLEEKTGLAEGQNENPNYVHSVPYSDYGIQQATPEHYFEKTQLIGTQMRKLITSDMSDDIQVEVNGRKMSKKEWIDLYNEVVTENIIESFSTIGSEFRDPKRIEELIQKEIRDTPRYSKEIAKACLLDENGHFVLPLFDPIQANIILTLMNSIIRNRVTKQKIKGGTAIQVTDYGLRTDLRIVYNTDKDGNKTGIKYMECMVPASNKDILELCDDEGFLDINKINDAHERIFPVELREMIGYRVPTEDKYSMCPLRIVGFLPQQSGSAIMLPSEITTISGSDFDVDKLFLMMYEYKVVQHYFIKRAWDDFYNDPENADIKNEIDKKLGIAFEDYNEKYPENDLEDVHEYFREVLKPQGVKKYQLSETAQDRFADWFNKRRENYRTSSPVMVKIQYDRSLSAQDNSRAARNNMMMDLMKGVLTNKDTASKLINPGGFEPHAKSAGIVRILQNCTEKQIKQELASRDLLSKGQKWFDVLMSLDLDTVEEIADVANERFSPTAITTQITFFQRNMTGVQLKGIYANHNSNHAVMQHTGLELKSKFAIRLNAEAHKGQAKTSLHEMKTDSGEYISRTVAGFTSASFDNAKKPILGYLNQNTVTADATMVLARLGYSTDEIGLFMTQPAVVEIVNAINRNVGGEKYKNEVVDEVLEKYRKLCPYNGAYPQKTLKYSDIANDSNTFPLETLARDILGEKYVKNGYGYNPATLYSDSTTENQRSIGNYYLRQYKVGIMFKELMRQGEKLSSLISSTKADVSNGAAGPTAADTIAKLLKLRSFMESTKSEDFPFNNSILVTEGLLYDSDGNRVSDEELRVLFKSSPVPYMQAFYTLGLEGSVDMLRPYFPQLTDTFMDIVKAIASYTSFGTLDTQTINSIQNGLFTYILSKIGAFGNRESRKEFMDNFPRRYLNILKRKGNEDLKNINLLNRIRYKKATKSNPRPTLIYSNMGSSNTTTRDNSIRDWATLLYMRNEDGTPRKDARQLAIDLFIYSYYRNGFAFGPNTFTHLAPVILRELLPDYLDTLNDLNEEGGLEKYDASEFIDQYIRNNLNNTKLVAQVSSNTSVPFTYTKEDAKDENFDKDKIGEFKDTVTIPFSSKSSNADKRLLKGGMPSLRKNQKTGKSYYFYDYRPVIAARKKNGTMAYYKLDYTKSTFTGKAEAVYNRIYPLGKPNQYLEYYLGESNPESELIENRSDYANTVRKNASEAIRNAVKSAGSNEKLVMLSLHALVNGGVVTQADVDNYLASQGQLKELLEEDSEALDALEKEYKESGSSIAQEHRVLINDKYISSMKQGPAVFVKNKIGNAVARGDMTIEEAYNYFGDVFSSLEELKAKVEEFSEDNDTPQDGKMIEEGEFYSEEKESSSIDDEVNYSDENHIPDDVTVDNEDMGIIIGEEYLGEERVEKGYLNENSIRSYEPQGDGSDELNETKLCR